MHGYSVVDGFAELNECLAEMIKYMANEPSVGLYYVQQHTQNAVPNVINLKNNVVEKARETTLHAEDLEDSISMVGTIKKFGFPIADQMIRDIKKSLAIMSTKQSKKGLICNSRSSIHAGSSSSWSSAMWGRSAVSLQQKDSYFLTVFMSARQKTDNIIKDLIGSSLVASSNNLNVLDAEARELPVLCKEANEPEEEEEKEDENGLGDNPKLLLLAEKFDELKASKEAQLEEWLKEETDGAISR